MNYLIVNHIAACRGPDRASLIMPRGWVDDLRASAAAVARLGHRLLVATPINDTRIVGGITLTPDAEGFEHIEIPGYAGARDFLRHRGVLRSRLRDVVKLANVVQFDLGGHPMPLGLYADESIGPGMPRLWMIGDTDPFEQLRTMNADRGAGRRLAGHGLNWRLDRQLRSALHRADFIIAGTHHAAESLDDVCRARTQVIEALRLREADLISTQQIESRVAHWSRNNTLLRIVVEGNQSAARGTEHVLQAIAKCRRLRVPVELIVAGDGPDIDHFRVASERLGIGPVVQWITDPLLASMAADECDLLVDAPLTESARRDLSLFVARGLCPIAYGNSNAHGPIEFVKPGHIDHLADQILRHALDRTLLMSRMLAGLAWARGRTIDAAHRKRIELAAELGSTKGAA
jgi:hypothetical protein